VTHDNYSKWKGWDSDAFGTWHRADGIYFNAELTKCGVGKLAGRHVLELGFGNGAFAGWATREGATYLGIDVIPALVARGRKAGYDVHLAGPSVCDVATRDSLDLVVAFDVLEHFALTDLEQKLRDVGHVLKVGGRLIARVPSGDSPFARAAQHGDLTHRLTLGASAVRQLAASVGFAVDQCREPVFPLLGLGVRSFMRRSLVMLGRAMAYPVVTHVLMGGGSPVLSPNMIFVFRKAWGEMSTKSFEDFHSA
jgi:SAM-dependent methyltransferase